MIRVISALLAGGVLLGLAACGSDEPSPAPVAAVGTPTSTSAATAPKQPIVDLTGYRLRQAIAAITSAGYPASAIVDSSGTKLAEDYDRFEHRVVSSTVYGDQVLLTLTVPATSVAPIELPAPAPTVSVVTYKVYGPKRASVTYSTEGFGQQQDTSAKLPWSKDVTEVDYPVLIAQNAGGGSITCEILRDGQVITQQTSTGSYAVVSCSP